VFYLESDFLVGRATTFFFTGLTTYELTLELACRDGLLVAEATLSCLWSGVGVRVAPKVFFGWFYESILNLSFTANSFSVVDRLIALAETRRTIALEANFEAGGKTFGWTEVASACLFYLKPCPNPPVVLFADSRSS